MSSQRPGNTFRNTPQQPRPKIDRNTRSSGTSRWDQARRYVRERPLLERVYRLCIRVFLWLFFGSLGYVIVLKYVPVWMTPFVVSRWVATRWH